MPDLKTLDQQRAAFAWDKVNAVRGGLKDYLSLVRNLPSMLLTNGLGQTLAFLATQDGAKRELYQHLQEWLCERVYQDTAPDETPALRLICRLNRGNSLTLRHATLEAQALAVWLKRFAEALDQDRSPSPDADTTSVSDTAAGGA